MMSSWPLPAAGYGMPVYRSEPPFEPLMMSSWPVLAAVLQPWS